MIIDATNLVLGRLASFVAKQARLGEKIDIVNCDKAVITGKKTVIFKKYKELDEKGTTQWGPYLQKQPDRFVRRTIRGMIDHKKPAGKEAYHRVMCYTGVPAVFVGKEYQKVEAAELVEKAGLRTMTVEQVTQLLKQTSLPRIN